MSQETTTEKAKEEQTNKKTEQQIIDEEAKRVAQNITKPVQLTPEQWKEFMNAQQKQIEVLAEKQNGYFTKILETFKPNTEAVPSSPAGGAGVGNDSLKKIAEYIGSNGLDGEGRWTLNKNEYIDRWWNHYCNTVFRRKEAVTSTNTPGITFDRDVLLIPGGQSVINIRPFVNYKDVPDGSDTFHWHKLNKLTFGAITAGSTISTSSQTASRIAGTVTERGALQKISFLQQRTLPYDLVNAVNDTFMMAALHDEASQVLTEAATASGGDLQSGHWIFGDLGDDASSDDEAGSTPLKFAGMNEALELLETQGYRREECTAFLHPKQHAELLSDAIVTNNVDTYSSGRIVDGSIERYLGCRIVVTPAVHTFDHTTTDMLRAIVAVPSALGLASKGSVEIESQRRVEESQIFATGRHYIDAAVIEATGYVRVSTTA